MKTTLKTAKFYCKVTSQENQLESQEAAFYSTLTADYNTQFANQSAILKSLTSAFEPILQAGPGQFGFTPQETTSLRTGATDTIANSYLNAQTALNQQIASRGGGNMYLPSGAADQLQAGLQTSAASQQAATQNQITQAGYAQGLSNFDTAASALGGVSSQYNPTGYAGQATSANQAAFNEADIIQQQNTAWEGQLGGIIGGVAGSFLGGVGKGIGQGIGAGSQTASAMDTGGGA